MTQSLCQELLQQIVIQLLSDEDDSFFFVVDFFHLMAKIINPNPHVTCGPCHVLKPLKWPAQSVRLRTTALVQIKIPNQTIAQNFHIVDKTFPIPTDEILGRDFLAGWKCNIDYNTWILSIRTSGTTLEIPITNNLKGKYFIPPRCEVIRKLNLNDIEDSITIADEIQNGVFYAISIINRNCPYIKIMYFIRRKRLKFRKISFQN